MRHTTIIATLLVGAGIAIPQASAADETTGIVSDAQEEHRWAPGQVIVKFATLPTNEMLHTIEREVIIPVSWRELRHAPHARGKPDQPHPLAFVRIMEVDPTIDVQALAALVGTLDGVARAQVNSIPKPTLIPNDPLFPQQWAPTKIHSPDAWDISLGSHDVIVASIDTGTVLNHEDLMTANWVNTDEIPNNGIDDDGNGFIDDVNGWDFVRNTNQLNDVYGHGTQVAGIMGADINNATGIAGMAESAIMHVKWWHTSGTEADVAECIYYAVDNGARVLNMSLSCGCLLPLVEDAVQYGVANDVLSVAAAGNHGGSNPHYPAGYDEVMAISGININDVKPGFSGWGPHIDVAGPTEGILSTGPGGTTDYDPGFSGTSAATPHVAGVAGLILAINPDLRWDEVRQIIRDTAEDVGDPGFDNFFGYGRVHAADAAAAAVPQCPADIDGNGVLDAGDFFAYLDLFAAGDPDADLTGNGVIDANDFFAYLDLFAAGC